MESNGHGTVRVVRAIEAAGDVTLERALVGMVSGRDVHLTMAGAGPVIASGQVAINQGGCGPLMTGGDVTIHQGGSGPIIAKGDVSIEQGGCQSVIAAGGATLGRQSFVGMVLPAARRLVASPSWGWSCRLGSRSRMAPKCS